MAPIDLTKSLKNYKSGWVAVNKQKKVVAHAPSFAAICRKIKEGPDLLLLPAAKNYFGFVASVNG